jgi:hypothetical protein
MIDEVQDVYRLQGVKINDKHIEVIVRQMLQKWEILDSGETTLLKGEHVDKVEFDEANEKAMAKGGARHRASRSCWASPRRRCRPVLHLGGLVPGDHARAHRGLGAGQARQAVGLKENVIVGRLIPAGTGGATQQVRQIARARRGAGRVAHSTISAGLRTDFGSFRVLVDANGRAAELSWGHRWDRGQVELLAAGVEGARDRWGNRVSDRYHGATLGYRITDQWVAGARHFSTDGDTRANSGWGDGSRQTLLSTSYEFMPDHHVFGQSTTLRQYRTNAAATAVVETIDAQVFTLGYFFQLDENLSATLSLNLNDSSSELGRADTIQTLTFQLAAKW